MYTINNIEGIEFIYSTSQTRYRVGNVNKRKKICELFEVNGNWKNLKYGVDSLLHSLNNCTNHYRVIHRVYECW